MVRGILNNYFVVSMDFQTFGSADFSTEHIFSFCFASSFVESFESGEFKITGELQNVIEEFEKESSSERFTLRLLFKGIRNICAVSEKPIVLMIDEVDSATNNQVFLDFLAQLRAQYIRRFQQPAFKSVILAGVYDVKNLKRKLRSEDEHRINSPWNMREGNESSGSLLTFDDCPWDYREPAPYSIAADFKIDMSFSKTGIAGMLCKLIDKGISIFQQQKCRHR